MSWLNIFETNWNQQLNQTLADPLQFYDRKYLAALSDYKFVTTKALTRMVYIASPFTHKNKSIEHKRYLKITRVAASLTKQFGYAFFCPITQSYALRHAEPSLGTDFEAWRIIDLEMIRRSDEVWVIMMQGWNKSVGVLAEIEYAKKQNKTIKYLNPNTLKVIAE